jgi:recombination protein RecT
MENSQNSTAPAEVTKLTAKALFNKDEVKAKFQEMLGKRATSFITSVLQIVASNKYLQAADPNSVYHSAAVAATLDLPLNNALGFACIVPYNESYKDANNQWHKRQVAQFQMMYKGYKQLALRSGQFVTMHGTDVREGELIKRNRLTGEIVFKWEEDEDKRNALKIIGYVSYFELLNGFSQTFYMTVKELHDHGKKYSQTFQNNKGKWVDDFPAMCMKTVTKLNLSKNAPLSVDMQKAIIADQAVIKDSDTMEVDYVDNDTSALGEPVTYEDLMALSERAQTKLSEQEFEDVKRILSNKEENSYRKIFDLMTYKLGDNGAE